MLNWTWPQYKAAGKHVASFAGGAVVMAASMHYISPGQAVDVNGNLTHVFNGLEELGTGMAGLIAFATPFYTAWRASHNAAPPQQAAALLQSTPLPIEAVKALNVVAFDTPVAPTPKVDK